MAMISRIYRGALHGLLGFIYRHALLLISSMIVAGATIVVLWPYSFHLIPAGSKGVLFKPLTRGTDLDTLYEEGFVLTWPWSKLVIYDSRIQQKTTTLEVLTSDRLKSTITLSFQFSVNPTNLPLLHKYVGPKYYETVVLPNIESATRDIVAKYGSAEAFTKELQKIEETISLDTTNVILNKISPPGLDEVRLFTIFDVQLVKFSFPQEVEAALQQKAVELAKSEAYQYRLSAERQEAERKQIEANGIRDFQNAIKDGLTENYLRFKGIEASLQLASSPNSKIIMFGSNSAAGMPLVFDPEHASAPKANSVVPPQNDKAAATTTKKQ